MNLSIALWCNGNTVPFGGIIHGSNPCGAVPREKELENFVSKVSFGTKSNR